MAVRRRITYYDFNRLRFASAYLTGFLENTREYGYDLLISRAVPELLRQPGMEGPWRDILFSISLFKAEIGDREFYFVIDVRDGSGAPPNTGMGYHLPLLEQVEIYFKVNYNEIAIATNADVTGHADKIVPVLPSLPVRPHRPWSFLPRIDGSQALGWSSRDSVVRLRDLAKLPGLKTIPKLRHAPEKMDLFFVMMYYHDPVHAEHNEFRYRLIKEIRKHRHLSAVTGLASRQKLPGRYAEFHVQPYRMRAHFEALASSRLGIYVRGLHDCLSFKFSQLLALGLPVVGQTIPNNRDQIYANPHFEEQFAFDDPEEIVAQAVELLRHPDTLARWGHSNAEVFERRFTPGAVVRDVLQTLLDAAEGKPIGPRKQELVGGGPQGRPGLVG